jgi:hypothetical protein
VENTTEILVMRRISAPFGRNLRNENYLRSGDALTETRARISYRWRAFVNDVRHKMCGTTDGNNPGVPRGISGSGSGLRDTAPCKLPRKTVQKSGKAAVDAGRSENWQTNYS